MVQYSMVEYNTNMRILHSGSKAKTREISETRLCSICMFMCYVGPLFMENLLYRGLMGPTKRTPGSVELWSLLLAASLKDMNSIQGRANDITTLYCSV